jgi:Cu(I)/Ag(I) efflux system membrane fusion protein/cobalt-zinc-cadmium efflux system membrane fusion protein
MKPMHVLAALVLAAVAATAGWWLGSRSDAGSEAPAVAGSGPCPGGADALHWKAPMDPTYVRDEPGKSPMGMDLVPVCPGEDAVGGGVVRIDPALVQSMGVRTAPVDRRDLSRHVRALGRVDYDERLVDHVHTKVQGWIEKLFVEYVGEMVEQGQPIAEIYSPELVSTQEELLQAARYRESTSQSSFDDVVEGGEALFRASKRRLELWDIPERDIRRLLETGRVRKNLTLYAPGPGVVVDLMAREGMEVDPNMRLYTIADLSHIWVHADVYEYELPWVEVGQRAVAELSYLPRRRFEGEVTYVYPFLDPKTRTARVRLEFENPDLVLKPDMFANVTIETRTQEDVLAVPNEAILRSGQRSLAIVALGEGRFEPRSVRLGIDGGDGWIEVSEGLAEGERVVTSGQFLIDSESRLQEAVQKLTSEAPAAEPEQGEHEGHDAPAAMETPEADPHAGHDMPAMEHDAEDDPHAGHDMPAMDPDAGPPRATRDAHEGHARE